MPDQTEARADDDGDARNPSLAGLTGGELSERLEGAVARAQKAARDRFQGANLDADALATLRETERGADVEASSIRAEFAARETEQRTRAAVREVVAETMCRFVSADESEALAEDDRDIFDRLARATVAAPGETFDEVFAKTWADGGKPLPGLDQDETLAVFRRWQPIAGAGESAEDFGRRVEAAARARGVPFSPTAGGVRRVAYALDSGTGSGDTAAGAPTLDSPLVPAFLAAPLTINDPEAGGIFQPGSSVRPSARVIVGMRRYPQLLDDGGRDPIVDEGADPGDGGTTTPTTIEVYSFRVAGAQQDITREVLDHGVSGVLESVLTIKRRRAQREVSFQGFTGPGATTGKRTPRGFLPRLPSQTIPKTATGGGALAAADLEAALAVVARGPTDKHWFATRSFISTLRGLTEESGRLQLLRAETGIAGRFAETLFGYPVLQATDAELQSWEPTGSANASRNVAAFGTFRDLQVELSPVPHLNLFSTEPSLVRKNSVGVFYSLRASVAWTAHSAAVGLTPAVRLATAA